MKYRIKKDSKFIDNEIVYWIQKKHSVFTPWVFVTEGEYAVLFNDPISAESYINKLIYDDKQRDTTLESALIVSAILFIVTILTVIYKLG